MSTAKAIIPSVTKPHIAATLLAVDTTNKVHLAERAIEKCLEQATFDAVKLLTDNSQKPYAIKIPRIEGLEGYSNFCIRDMDRYVDTNHALVVQYDGYVLNASAWRNEWLRYDYIGAPWLPSRHVGNGGFSLRSKKLLTILANGNLGGQPHPEDNYICTRYAPALRSRGIQFAPYPVAERFAFEGRSWNGFGKEWEGVPLPWNQQFGFHSWLTPLTTKDRPLIFHHSGDLGDVIYSLPVIKAKGGGVLFISPNNRYPYPRPTRETPTPEWTGSLASLTECQPYCWRCLWTHATPFSTDHDLNSFREYYRRPGFDPFASLFTLNQRHFGTNHPETEPWLTVPDPRPVEGRPIIVSRSLRYHDPTFPWGDLCRRYAGKLCFVGTEEEYEAFRVWGDAAWMPTANLREVARIIAGGKVFIGNQSAPMAIALGLGQNVIQETWHSINPNCLFDRPNFISYRHGPLVIPEKWL